MLVRGVTIFYDGRHVLHNDFTPKNIWIQISIVTLNKGA